MSTTRDLASDQQIVLIYNASISSPGTVSTSSIDTAAFDSGNFLYIASHAFTSGTFDITLRESDDNSTWNDVDSAKLNYPDGNDQITAVLAVDGSPQRLGSFSTKRYLKLDILAGNTPSATFTAYAIIKAEQRPTF